ncbi:MAG: hypothetical protein FWD61_13790 [Phycisphaerales bacterium]|nr:hypothetical protein [Phycisphaerales bacterium]
MEYTRIQVGYNARTTGRPAGVFAACHHLRRDGRLVPHEDQLFEEINQWFKRNLIEPQFYKVGNPEKAISWFKPAGNHFVDRLRPLVELLALKGVAVEIIRTEFPGRIIYEDDFQVGAV